MSRFAFSAKDIHRLFGQLNDELARDDVQGELYLVGGAVMCLVFNARPTTRGVDALFKPSKQLRAAAVRVAHANDISEAWLNDGVKGFFSKRGRFNRYLDLSHLKIYVADPAYLLAMKCLAARIGEEFHDVGDIGYLLRYLNLEKSEDAKAVLVRYYPLEQFPQKTLHLLDELLPD